MRTSFIFPTHLRLPLNYCMQHNKAELLNKEYALYQEVIVSLVSTSIFSLVSVHLHRYIDHFQNEKKVKWSKFTSVFSQFWKHQVACEERRCSPSSSLSSSSHNWPHPLELHIFMYPLFAGRVQNLTRSNFFIKAINLPMELKTLDTQWTWLTQFKWQRWA